MKITSDIAEAREALRAGRVVGVPTGTSYGLAVDALQGHALQRLRNLKKRSAEKPFTVCLDQKLWAHYLRLTRAEHNLLVAAEREAAPLTLLVTPHAALQHLAQDNRVGVRAIDHPVLHAFAAAAAVPITATSANVADGPPCTTAQCVLSTFPGLLDPAEPAIARAGPTTYDLSLGCVLDGGELPERTVSTIAYLDAAQQPVIVRQGALTEAELARLLSVQP